MNERPHLSPSQISMWMRCPEQYRRVYLEGARRTPPGIAAHIGTGVHSGLQHNYGQKIESHEDVPPSEIVDAAVASYDYKLADEGFTKDDRDARKKSLIVDDSRDKTAQLAMFAGTKVVKDYQPIATEQRFRIHLPSCSHDIIGIVDLVTDKQAIVDTKTTGRKKSQVEADHSIQLTTYALSQKLATGKYPKSVIMDVILRKNGPPERQVLKTKRGPADTAALAVRINVMLESIKRGVFNGANPATDWNCSQRWCGFFNDCPFTVAHR